MRHQIIAFTGSQPDLTQICAELLNKVLLEQKGHVYFPLILPFSKREPEYILNYRRKARTHLLKQGSNTKPIVITEPVNSNDEATQIKALGGLIIHSVCQGHEDAPKIKEEFIALSIYDSSTVEALKKNIQYLMRDKLV